MNNNDKNAWMAIYTHTHNNTSHIFSCTCIHQICMLEINYVDDHFHSIPHIIFWLALRS